MGAGMWGMNIDEVRNLATQFGTQADAVEAVIQALDGPVNDESMWMGPDADSFRAEWNDTHKTNLTNTAQALRDAGSKATANADQQEQASGA